MRLLLTTDTIGGVWTFTATLGRELLTAGHALALVSFGRQPSSAQRQAVERLKIDFGDYFYFVASDAPLEWMEENDQAWERGERVLLRAIEDFAPQLLHSSQMCFGRLNSTLPVLVTAHSDVLSWAECTMGLVGREQLERKDSAAWAATYRRLVQTGLDDAAVVVAPTHWMAATLARLFELSRLPDVVSNGVVGCRGDGPRRLQAVTAGRLWDAGKGLSVLHELDLPLPLLVAGEGYSTRAPSSQGIEWLGNLPHGALLALFAESAIYLATSVYEPFGLAPVEAASSGCAIVARDLASFREVWGDGALYFTSAESLQSLLNSLVRNPRRLQGAQCRARQRASRYTAPAMTDAYLAIYEKVLAPSVMLEETTFAHA